MSLSRFRSKFVAITAFVLIASMALATNVAHDLSTPFTQNWTTDSITASDDWSGVVSVIGYRGDAMTGGTGVNPGTVVAEGGLVVDVNANQTTPNSFATGGVTEFNLTDRVVALAGSGTARAPHIVIHLNTTGRSNINVAYTLRDLEDGADNAVQPVALQYRVGGTGNYVNVPDGFVADATAGPSLFGPNIGVSTLLPADANNAANVQVRIITTDAVGSDEWVGIDDISITSSEFSAPPSVVGLANPDQQVAGGSTEITATVTPGTGPASTGLAVTGDLTQIGLGATQTFYDDGVTGGDDTAGDNIFTYTATIDGGTSTGLKNLPLTVTDLEARSGTDNTVALTVVASTPPGVSGSVNPSTVGQGENTLLTATVTAGQVPTSLSYTVTADLTALPGGSATEPMFDDGAHGDGGVGDGVFGLTVNVPVATTTGVKALGLTVTDDQNRTGTNSVNLTVVTPVSPSVTAPTATPSSLLSGETTLLTATVAQGNYPVSPITSVTVNLTTIGGIAAQPMYDDQTNGDVTLGDGVYSYSTAATGSAGAKVLTVTATDGQARTGTANINLTILAGITPISTIQGSGVNSTFDGQLVTTRGIVTARRSGSFYIQTPDASVDGNAATSEGIMVFTSSAPPAAAQVGNYVTVTGTVDEFRPGSNTNSMNVTELTSPTVSLVSTGNTLPVPVTLTAGMMSPAGDFAQLEHLEGMRVQGNFTATAGSEGGTNEETGVTFSAFGDFHAVITGIARPMREEGVSIFDTLPVGAPANIPRFDENPENMRVNSDGVSAAYKLEVAAGATMDLVGVLDYDKGPTQQLARYTIIPTEAPSNVVNPSFRAVTTPTADQITIGSFNVERLFDSVDDTPCLDDPIVTANYLNNVRLPKLSMAIRNVMKTPDVLGVIEVENLSVLQALATRINNDAVANAQPDPQYVARLIEGNDIGGIDVGFLIKSSRVAIVEEPIQINPDATWDDPNCTPDVTPPCTSTCPPELHDRPSLAIKVAVNNGTDVVPVTVVVNHLRSLSGINTDRTQTKRKLQAEDIAQWVQARQVADPTERIVMVGDFNTFQFSDGYVDVLNTIAGDPAPADEVVKATTDFVTPDLEIVEDPIVTEQYSFEFDGNAQALDHALVTANLGDQVTIEHARNNADFPESYRTDAARPERSADHDMFVAYLNPQKHFTVSAPLSVNSGTAFSFTVTARNANGSVDTTYEGTVEFDSSDNGATLPAQFTFSAEDSGVFTFTATLVEMGTQDIRVSDILTDASGSTTTNVLCALVPMVASNSGPACVNSSATFNVDYAGASSYAWTGPNGFTANTKNPTRSSLTIADAGLYTVTVTLANGCVYNASTTLTVTNGLAAPTITAPLSVTIGSTDNVASITEVPGAVYNWTVTGSSVSTGQGTNSITFPAGTAGTTLTISVSVTSGGCTANASVKSQTDFLDVPPSSLYRPFINTIARNGITAGCGGGNYCPANSVTREQMAVFLLVAKYGAGYVPPTNATSRFDDVDVASPYSKWIEVLADLGITAGCGGNNYCPGAAVTRDQMAVFLLVAKEGTGYTPPDPTGVFDDVPTDSLFARWIEELALRNITSGCGNDNYCPSNPATREQMAVFLKLTFNLQ